MQTLLRVCVRVSVDKDLSPAWKQGASNSLKGIFAGNPPTTSIESWNELLKHYDVI